MPPDIIDDPLDTLMASTELTAPTLTLDAAGNPTGRYEDEITIRIAAVIDGDERYIVLYPPGCEEFACRAVGRWAENKELGFSWETAARLSKEIRELKADFDEAEKREGGER